MQLWPMGRGNKMTAKAEEWAQNSSGPIPKESKPIRTKQKNPN